MQKGPISYFNSNSSYTPKTEGPIFIYGTKSLVQERPMSTLALSANMACPYLTLALYSERANVNIGPFQFNGLLCLFITNASKTALFAPKTVSKMGNFFTQC